MAVAAETRLEPIDHEIWRRLQTNINSDQDDYWHDDDADAVQVLVELTG